MDAPRPTEVHEFGEYRFTINYPPRFPQGDRPLDPAIEAALQAYHDANLTTPNDIQAPTWWLERSNP